MEIERKFLVKDDSWKAQARGVDFRQGYLNTARERVVRIRIMEGRAFLTVKGESTGVTRPEFEYEIPWEDANAMLDLCEKPLVEKTRYEIEHAGQLWEVDEFHGANDGLVIAECELETEDQAIERPPWLGEEVSNDPRYFNANLVSRPYSNW